MKKLFSILLVVALLLSFAACGNDNDNVSSVLSEDVSAEVSSDDAEKQFVRGVITGSTYENEFLGLGVELDENWVFYTDEEIAALYGLTNELLGDDFEEYLKNATVIYDMQVTNKFDASNVNVNFEKLSVLGEVQTANMEVFVSSIMPTVVNSLESIGCTDVSFELVEFEIDGKTFYGGKTKADLQGLELYQALICVKCEGYVSNITITSVGADRIDSILDGFFVVK